jgi:plastocyanin
MFEMAVNRGVFAWTGAAFVLLGVAAPPVLGQQFQEQSAARFPLPALLEYTNQCTIGDLDNDGDPDIVWANGGGYNTASAPLVLRIFKNNGAGTFTDESVASTGGLTFRARGAELGDVDDDGDLDIIVAQDFNGQPALLINNGPGIGLGTFTDQTLARLPIGTFSSTRAQFADVDNDGDLDLYLTNGGATNRFGSGRGKLWLNNGSGVYTDVTTTNMPNQNVSEPQDCIFGDIDADFDLDLRIGSSASNQSKLYRNNGSGVFTQVTTPSDNNCYSYDFGDMDGDGDLDLLGANGASSGNNAELLLINNGSGTYSTGAFTGSTVDDNDSKFFDYDNDGDFDLVIASLSTTERIYNNNGAGTLSLAGGVIQSISDASLDVKVADLTGDGRLDIITAQGESGGFTNRFYVNVSGPIDDRAPVIQKTEQVPSVNGTGYGPFPVRAIIFDSHTSDRGFHDKGVTLNWRYVKSTLAGFTQVPMKWVGNSIWRGLIPEQTQSGTIEYFVTALDFNNNLGTGSTLNFNLTVPCAADVTGNGVVDIDDLLGVINAWGEQNVTNDITVEDFEFIPSQLNAKSGDTLQWSWVSGLHIVTSGTPCTGDGRFNAPSTRGSPLFQYVIPHAFNGAIPYFCTPHCASGMTAGVTVAPFAADTNGSGGVDIDDLLAIINAWGACP